MEFSYKEDSVYFIQSKYEKTASYKIDTDGEYEKVVYNKWLRQDLTIEKEKSDNSTERYSVLFMYNGACYRIVGAMDEKEFSKIVERLIP